MNNACREDGEQWRQKKRVASCAPKEQRQINQVQEVFNCIGVNCERRILSPSRRWGNTFNFFFFFFRFFLNKWPMIAELTNTFEIWKSRRIESLNKRNGRCARQLFPSLLPSGFIFFSSMTNWIVNWRKRLTNGLRDVNKLPLSLYYLFASFGAFARAKLTSGLNFTGFNFILCLCHAVEWILMMINVSVFFYDGKMCLIFKIVKKFNWAASVKLLKWLNSSFYNRKMKKKGDKGQRSTKKFNYKVQSKLKRGEKRLNEWKIYVTLYPRSSWKPDLSSRVNLFVPSFNIRIIHFERDLQLLLGGWIHLQKHSKNYDFILPSLFFSSVSIYTALWCCFFFLWTSKLFLRWRSFSFLFFFIKI